MIRTIFKALGRSFMDVSLRSGAGHVVRIVERPGRWMEDAALADLSAQLRSIAARTLPAGGLTYGVFSGDKARMGDVIITLVCRADGTPIAFNALAIMQLDTGPHLTEVLHLGLVMVDPDERSKNLSWVLYGLTCFLVFFRRQFRPVWISNVTQVPAVVGMVSGMFSDVWPGPQAGRRTLNHLLLARQIMDRQRHVFGVGPEASFDEDRFVIENAYTGGSDDLKKTWDAAPKHRDDSYNAFCAAMLDYDRGDDVLQLGRMDLAAMRTYLSREVPKSAVFGLLVTGFIVGLRRVILPLVHWSDSTKAWATLRPWRAP
ncbi:hypothetical protein [Yoonia vestfoldensis]|uniref:hypothetical protein n=1 Tax=Yoonia vestfoldensis TaxID=245188 RepID=UPI00035CB021|nr:hypothetical protein [Yoonia vestfoldensis]